MGIKDAWNRQMERSRIEAAYGVHSVTRDGNYRYMPLGSLKQQVRPVAGAVAEYEAGSVIGGRTTLTRVAAGAIIAGPVGAIVGGMFKKDRGRGYVTVTFPDGAVAVVDGPIKDEDKMRQFVARVNEAARRT
ncbi:hypothetical protein [Microbacterium sp. KR10-403]|uniref:hypothetical protein n=1 Tax=Microbacterium sp. KR10-403 TaxID=3158581 RepID=UPI0032E431BE